MSPTVTYDFLTLKTLKRPCHSGAPPFLFWGEFRIEAPRSRWRDRSLHLVPSFHHWGEHSSPLNPGVTIPTSFSTAKLLNENSICVPPNCPDASSQPPQASNLLPEYARFVVSQEQPLPMVKTGPSAPDVFDGIICDTVNRFRIRKHAHPYEKELLDMIWSPRGFQELIDPQKTFPPVRKTNPRARLTVP